LSLQFQRRIAVLRLRQEIHPQKLSRQRQLGVLDNCAAGHRGLVIATMTLIQAACGNFTVADVPTLWTYKSAGPPPLKQGIMALFMGAILIEELWQTEPPLELNLIFGYGAAPYLASDPVCTTLRLNS